jgi:hypothetical protein
MEIRAVVIGRDLLGRSTDNIGGLGFLVDNVFYKTLIEIVRIPECLSQTIRPLILAVLPTDPICF